MTAQKIPFNLKLTIKHESLLRRFTIVFFTLYFFPLAILFFLLHDADVSSSAFLRQYEILIDKGLIDRFFLLFLASSLISFLWGRSIFVSLMKIAKTAEEIAKGNLGQKLDDKGDKEIVELARSFNTITNRLEENVERLKMSKKMVQEVLYRISTGMADPTKSMQTFLRLILDTTMSAVDSYRGALILLSVDNKSFYVECSQGYTDLELQKKIQPGSEEELVIRSSKPILVPHIGKDVETSICVPLKHKDKTIGSLSFSGKIGDSDFSQDEIVLLSNIAMQIAVAIVNERLNVDAEQTYKQTISALALAVEARDAYSRGHSDRVAKYSMMLAKKIGLEEKMISLIQDAAELHDVGKIGIEDDILRNPEKLSQDERTIMCKHPIIGESIVRPIRSLTNLCDLIRHHHEFLDGSGYPDGLKADELNVGVRILSVTDAYDAMTTDRPYRKGLLKEDAIAELRKFSNSHYDEKIVEAFTEVLLKENL